MSLKRCILSLLILPVFIAAADQLQLVDGSVICGEIQQVHAGKVTIKTDFAGTLTIVMGKVLHVSTVEPVMLAQGIAQKGQQLTLKNQDGKGIDALWRLDKIDPRLPKPPPPRAWAVEASVDITGKSGNTKKSDLGGGLKATLTGPDDKLMLFVRGLLGEEDGERNDQELVLGADFERMFGKSDSSWYVRGQVEHDKYDNYERYFTSAGGYGYYLFRNDFALMRLRLGINHIRKEYVNDQETEDGLGADFSYHHELNLEGFLGDGNWGKLVTDVTYTPSFEAWSEDYRIYHESAWDIPLGLSGAWKIRLGVSNEYNNLVSGDTKRLDTSYFARLIFQWK